MVSNPSVSNNFSLRNINLRASFSSFGCPGMHEKAVYVGRYEKSPSDKSPNENNPTRERPHYLLFALDEMLY